MQITLPNGCIDEQKRQRSREAQARYRQRHPDRIKAYRKKRWAEDREKLQAQKRRSALKHPETARAYVKKWRMENPERAMAIQKASRERRKESIAARHKDWQVRNAERVRVYRANSKATRRSKTQNRLSPKLAETLLRLQRHRCAACACVLKKYHLDHIVPLHLGGPHCDENIQLLCPTCNIKKSHKLPEVFMRERGKLL